MPARARLFLMVAALLSFVSVHAAVPQRISLSGTVRTASGSKIRGATVTVLDSRGAALLSGTTDAAGAFRLDGFVLEAGRFEISVRSGGVTVVRTGFVVPPDLRIDTTRFNLVVGMHKTGRAAPRRRPSGPLRDRPVERALPPPPAGGAGAGNHTVVRVFYATDRNLSGVPAPAAFYGGERGDRDALQYGTCEVSIPRHHVEGELEAPSIWRFELRENPDKHVVLKSVKVAEEADFYRELQGRVLESRKREAFVFIHGYNVSFADAARRTAQLSYDLKYDAAPIFYSWPSTASVARYVEDVQNVDWTVPHLARFLEEVRSRTNAEVVHLIAHSMGSRALAYALQAMSVRDDGARFNQVVLAAPDIDRDVFRTLAQKIVALSQRVTVYSSSNDEAMVVSKNINGYPRLGDSAMPIFIYGGIDVVDASSVNTGLLGHSYYGESKTVLDDLVILLKQGAPPALRRLTQRDAPGLYWTFAE